MYWKIYESILLCFLIDSYIFQCILNRIIVGCLKNGTMVVWNCWLLKKRYYGCLELLVA